MNIEGLCTLLIQVSVNLLQKLESIPKEKIK